MNAKTQQKPKDAVTPVVRQHVPSTAEDDEFLNLINSRAPPKEQAIVAALGRVKSVYVECGRDELLSKNMTTFVSLIMAKVDGKRDEGRVFFVTGESGTGKSRAVQRILAKEPRFQPAETGFGTINPVVTTTLTGPITLKILARRILRNAGYAIVKDMSESDLWDILPEQLHLRRVLLIHLDETQHMVRHTKAATDRIALAKAFKSVLNDPQWPVSFLMSGMPRTTELSRLDEQIERRHFATYLPGLEMPDSVGLVIAIIQEMCSAAGLGFKRAIAGDLPERVAHAARYQYGRVTQVTLAGIHSALQRGDGELTRTHFALAYLDHSHARGHDDMNPFLVDHWRNLEAGSFIFNKEASQ